MEICPLLPENPAPRARNPVQELYFLADVVLNVKIANRYRPVLYSPHEIQSHCRKICAKPLWERIEEGDLTGLRLAKETGFKQAHISNFLNRKRGLSIEGMDKVLKVQHLSVLDLLDPSEVNKRASILPPSEDEFENVLLVDGAIAATQPLVMSMNVKEILKFKKSFLRSLRPEMEGDRDHWERFVLIKVDGREGMSMYPRLLPGATVLHRPPLQFAQTLPQGRVQHVRRETRMAPAR